MAFSNQQLGRVRAAVVLAALVCVAAVAAFLVLSGGSAPVTGSSESDASTQTAQGAQADQADAVESIDAQYGTAAQSLRAQYEADPSNPSALLNLANGYFDWGVALRNHAADDDTAARARDLLAQAVDYYDTYLADNPGAKSATVDRAICVFYTGDTEGAIAALEALVAEDPSFAPAWANLGMFYESADRTDDARDAYQKAIDAAGDDDAYNVKSYAQERLDALA